jgi:hypothetical protein
LGFRESEVREALLCEAVVWDAARVADLAKLHLDAARGSARRLFYEVDFPSGEFSVMCPAVVWIP